MGVCGGGLGGYLKETSENVELKHRDVVVASEVNRGFESHGLQPGADGVHFVKALPEHLPGYYCPESIQVHRIRFMSNLLYICWVISTHRCVKNGQIVGYK